MTYIYIYTLIETPDHSLTQENKESYMYNIVHIDPTGEIKRCSRIRERISERIRETGCIDSCSFCKVDT